MALHIAPWGSVEPSCVASVTQLSVVAVKSGPRSHQVDINAIQVVVRAALVLSFKPDGLGHRTSLSCGHGFSASSHYFYVW